FRDRGMLVGEGTAILSMATQTELIHVRGAQVFARGSAMRIVAVGTAHLPFPQRVVIRQTHFSALALVTAQASIVALPARLHEGFAFRHEALHGGNAAWSGHVDEALGPGPAF